jgi:omega-amidase
MPREPLSIIGLQTPLVWNDPEANRNQLGQQLAALSIPQSSLVVFPEMFTTGFVSAPPSDPLEEKKTLSWMQEWSHRLNTSIAGSIACLDTKGRGRNRFLLVNPSGETTRYDKRHLFSFAAENRQFTAGEHRVECNVGDARVLLQVCYDLRFPVFSRNHPRSPYDLAIYVANWPEVRVHAWRALLVARAIENQCWVVGINRIGKDGEGKQYSGDSLIVDPKGHIVADGSGGAPQALRAQVDLVTLDAFRGAFPVLKDGDAK